MENEVATALKDSTGSMGQRACKHVTLILIKPWFHRGIKYLNMGQEAIS